MLAVYVHKDNPIKSLTLQQVDAIFSKTRKGGPDKDIRTWGDLGLTGEWAEQADQPLRPQLGVGHLRLLQGARALQGRLQGHGQGAAGQLGGRAGRRQRQVRRSATAASATRPPTCARCRSPRSRAARSIEATPENAYTGEYPLGRFLYLYVNYKPGTELDPLRARVHPLRVQQAGPGGRRQGRLLPGHASRSPTRRSTSVGLAGRERRDEARP